MITGASIVTDSDRTMPKAAKFVSASGRRAIAAWTKGPSSVISAQLAANGSQKARI
jgi:hypothetical protein